MPDEPLSDQDLQEAFNVLRDLSKDDLRQALDALRQRVEERPAAVQISASGFSKSSGSATLEIHDADHGHAVDAAIVLPGLSVSGSIAVPAVLVDEARAPLMTPDRAVALVILWLVTTSTTLSLQGEQEIATAFANLAGVFAALVAVLKAD